MSGSANRELEMPAELRPDAPVLVEPRPARLVALAITTLVGAFVLGHRATDVALPVLHGVATLLTCAVLGQVAPSARRADLGVAALIAALLHHGVLDRLWGTATLGAVAGSAVACVVGSQVGALVRGRFVRIHALAWVVIVAILTAGMVMIGSLGVIALGRGSWFVPAVLAMPALVGVFAQIAADGRIAGAALVGGAAAAGLLAVLDLYAMSLWIGALVAGTSCAIGSLIGWVAKGRRALMPSARLRR